jgi:predicted GTPase
MPAWREIYLGIKVMKAVIALIGRSNSGKSRRFNCLARRRACAVNDLLGTTCDVVVEELPNDITLMDTDGGYLWRGA